MTVLNESGSVLFTVDRVSDPPAVDENGNMYLSISNVEDTWSLDRSYQQPMGAIVSYNSVGSVEWLYTINGTLVRPDVAEDLRQLYGSLPMYQDGLLYVPVEKGIMALYTNGSVKWSREFDLDRLTLFSLMPIDEQGNVYLSQDNDQGVNLIILNKDGADLVSGEQIYFDRFSYACGDPYQGRIYYYESMNYKGQASLDNLITYNVAAYDLIRNEKLWDYAIPAEKTNDLVVNKNNVEMLGLADHGAESYLVMRNNNSKGAEIGTRQALKIMPAKDSIYLSFYTVNYESPLVLGRSDCLYSSAIYALGEDGALQWSRPTDSFATSMAANNSTIYYGTKGGKVVSAQMDSVVDGIALIALVYVFFRFFLVGAVTRARDRLDKNENRNRIFEFIARNPGETVHEISRGIGVNLGTVRYHIFILKLNHRIIISQVDGKYIRYFTNSNSYSKEEQLILSLMRRDVIGKVLGLMLKKPGISNNEIAKELGIRESVVSRSIKELSKRGVIARGQDGKRCYVEAVHKEHIIEAMKRIQSE